MHSERLLTRFLLDILKPAPVDWIILLGSLIDVAKAYSTSDVWTIEKVPNSMQELTRGD